MTLLTEENKRDLFENTQIIKKNGYNNGIVKPVARLYNQKKNITFLIYKFHEFNEDYVWGLFGEKDKYTKMEMRNLTKLENGRIKLKKDSNFNPVHTMDVYFTAADFTDKLNEDPKLLNEIATRHFPHSKSPNTPA